MSSKRLLVSYIPWDLILSLNATLQAHGISTIEDIKPGALDLILHYINLVLYDNYLSAAKAGMSNI